MTGGSGNRKQLEAGFLLRRKRIIEKTGAEKFFGTFYVWRGRFTEATFTGRLPHRGKVDPRVRPRRRMRSSRSVNNDVSVTDVVPAPPRFAGEGATLIYRLGETNVA